MVNTIQRKYKDCIEILERYGVYLLKHLNESDHSKQIKETIEFISQLQDITKVEIN